MALAFYFNIVVGVIILFITPGSPGDPTDYDYWLIIAHPISRLPVFLMGIFAGVLCTHIQEGDTSALNSMINYLCLPIEVTNKLINLLTIADFGNFGENCLLSWLEDNYFPFPFCKRNDCKQDAETRSWKRRVDVNMGCLWGTITISVMLPILFKYPLTKIDGPVAGYLRSDFGRHIFVIQLTAVYTELMIIVGLCLDGGKSVTSRGAIQ